LPCIADSTKFRIIARFEPPLGGVLKLLEPLFPRARFSERIGALIILLEAKYATNLEHIRTLLEYL
jgi:ArsR family metal-binding transcriptional regulator